MLDRLFNPQSIAVVGASRKPQKLGSVILKNIKKSKFPGEIYPVNPEADKIQSLKAYQSISDIDADIDLAVIVTPAKYVPGIIRESINKGVGNVIVITAGFKESSEEGAQLENKIKDLVQSSNTRLVGVNCLGIISNNSDYLLNATFAPFEPPNGNIAFMSQSGAFGTAALDYFAEYNLGLKQFVSLGNKTDINELDLLEAWSQDSSIECIAAYLENIVDGKAFVEMAKKVSLEKPIIILKPGKSESSQKAISSHTGSLVSDSEIASIAFNQSGIIEVETMQELFDLLKLIQWQGIPASDDIAVLTNAGGPGVQTTDLIEKYRLSLARLSEETRRTLKDGLPTAASNQNPIDILGDANASRYYKTLQITDKDPNVGIIYTILTPQSVTEPSETAVAISKVSKQSSKTTITSFIGGKQQSNARSILRRNKIPHFDFPDSAMRPIHLLSSYKKRKQSQINSSEITPTTSELEAYKLIKQILLNIKLKNPGNEKIVVPPQVCNKIFQSLGIKLPEDYYPNSSQETISIGKKWGYPLVMKISSPKLLHKTEEKGVYTNLQNQEDLITAFEKLKAVGNKLGLTLQSNRYIQIQKQILDGEELIMGVKKNSFGHAIIFGKGGVYTELYKDVNKKVTPLNDFDIQKLIEETKVYKVLSGYRGKKTYDIKDILKTIVVLNNLVQHVPGIKEIDINPFIVTENRGYAVDIKIIV
jgi:acetyltransferase